MRLLQIYESVKHNGLSSLLRQIVYFNRVAIVVEKDLLELDATKERPPQAPVEVIELRQDLLSKNDLIYILKNRYFKAVHYLEKGYGGYAIVKGQKIIGDIWFFAPDGNNTAFGHPDCQWLGLQCAENQVYTFDMFLNSDERGNNLASFLQSSMLRSLHEKGFTKAYGYYWGDNIPALWIHRLVKWKEIKRLKVNRFIFFKNVVGRDSSSRPHRTGETPGRRS